MPEHTYKEGHETVPHPLPGWCGYPGKRTHVNYGTSTLPRRIPTWLGATTDSVRIAVDTWYRMRRASPNWQPTVDNFWGWMILQLLHG
jgi:hypothetical protein